MAAPSPPPPLDFKNVQGDVLVALPKKTQTYWFFEINKARVDGFRNDLTALVPSITTTEQAMHDRHRVHKNKGSGHVLKISGVNIVFSKKGFDVLGITDKINDDGFDDGMLKDAKNLGDAGTTTNGTFSPDWDAAFKKDIHGMVLVTGDCHETVREELAKIERIFKVGRSDASVHEVKRLIGDVRPGKEKGHEHFGFLDGISNPAVAEVDTKPNPGQETVRQGIMLLGRAGDNDLSTNKPVSRPAWALDGSFLAFRYLPQLVPEFNLFLKENPIPIPGLSPTQGSELLGARLVGRWKSGAPIDITPLKDNPQLAADNSKNNDFRFAFPGDQQNQDRCPFGAHIRKTNPRADLEDLAGEGVNEPRRIMRRGIQFGPEMSHQEAEGGKTLHERGLLFACYQSQLTSGGKPNGFRFIQQVWANNPGFPPNKGTPGFDPIIGQPGGAQPGGPGPREMSGTNPEMQAAKPLQLPSWVLAKGGEYFFAPSLPALKNKFAAAAGPTGVHVEL